MSPVAMPTETPVSREDSVKHEPGPPLVPPDGKAKRSAALLSVTAAAVVTLLKLVTGLLTGSLGMLSESAHSGIDLIASGITLFSVRVSDRPADDDHNYGHGKVESLSAFVETVIMAGSCVWLVTEAVRRMASHTHLALAFSVWPFAVLLLSFVVDLVRSRSLRKIAREHHSAALAADAAHFATDMWASLAVMVGLAASYAGERYGLPWLEYADPAAAIVVSGIILHVSWRLARQTVDALLDATPSESGETPDEMRQSMIAGLKGIEGVMSVERLRTRRSGASYFADVTLGMPRNLTFQRSEQITMAAMDVVRRHLPAADVVVHSVPTASIAESVHDRIRAVAARRNLAIHDVSVQQYDGEQGGRGSGERQGGERLHVEQHLEVDETMPLRQAHELVTELEAEMRREIPAISTILTHIESEPATIERPALLERDKELEQRLRRVASGFPEILDIHEVFVTRRGPEMAGLGLGRAGQEQADHIQVSCHATLPDALPMARVHGVITALEGAFKLDAPEVDRLLIHPEPATDNRR